MPVGSLSAMPVVVHTPLPYEATPGIVAGVAPVGATHVQLEAPGVRARFRLPRRGGAFRVGPTGLPARDHTLVVRFVRGERTLAVRRVPHLYGLPARTAAFRPPTLSDAAAMRTLRGSRSQSGAVTGVWARNLATGRAASWNAGARFPAASTLKLAILMTVLARRADDPVRSRSWRRYAALIRDSSNEAANALLTDLGGSTAGGGRVVNGFNAALGLRDSDMYGGYVIGTSARPAGFRPAATLGDVPPVRVEEQAAFERGKQTTAHDLGLLLSALHAATLGRGPAAALGVSPREARVTVWLLLHARYAGLLDPAAAEPVAHKAGWLASVQHDAGLLFTPRGVVVLVVLTHREAGVSYAASRRYAAVVLRSLRRLRR